MSPADTTAFSWSNTTLSLSPNHQLHLHHQQQQHSFYCSHHHHIKSSNTGTTTTSPTLTAPGTTITDINIKNKDIKNHHHLNHYHHHQHNNNITQSTSHLPILNRPSRRQRVTIVTRVSSPSPSSSSSSSSSSISTTTLATKASSVSSTKSTISSSTSTITSFNPNHSSIQSSPSSVTTSTSTPPRMRASSPTAKSRYISRLKQKLQTQCVDCSADEFWNAMQEEARLAADSEPLLASFLFASILNHSTLYSALAFHLANKLACPAMPSTMLMRLFESIMHEYKFCHVIRLDLLAVMERDPACTRFIDAMLYFKGFHALQVHRIAHHLWIQGRIPLAYHLQSQVSKELQVDIHPAAQLGKGIFIDHATGIVVGETAVIGNNCSLLHHVTLGGSGKKHGDRHPKLGHGVLVGAGATLLGNVTVGDGAQIGACSLVLEDIPPHATVVGVPAKILRVSGVAVPALEMKHERCLPGCTDESHGHGKEVELVDKQQKEQKQNVENGNGHIDVNINSQVTSTSKQHQQ